ncbi:MAG: DUF4838 domain-containing protein [Lentisphaeria bacterium]
MRTSHLLFLVFLLTMLFTVYGGVDLVKNARPQASIVLAADASPVEKHAAEELAFFIKRITGVSLEISVQPLPGLLPVRIGKAAFASIKSIPEYGLIKEDGFIVTAAPDAVQLFATIERGILYSVYHVLHKYGKIYFLYPGEEGVICPENPDFSIAEGTEVKNPVFTERRFNLNGGSGWTPDTYDWLLRNGLVLYHTPYGTEKKDAKALFLESRAVVFSEGGHDMGALLVGYGANYTQRMEKLLQEQPEFFGLVDGKRLPAGNLSGASQPCTSNPQVLQKMLENCIQRIQESCGDRENIRGFCNDDHTIWCLCENCRSLDSPLENTSFNRRSTRWWHFINFMAKGLLDSGKCPNTRLATLAYQNFRLPPLGIKPDPRVLVGIAPHQRCYLHALDDPSCSINAEKFREMFEAWHRAGMRAYTFEYHPEMPGVTNYLFNEKAWVNDLKFYHRLNMAGYGMVTNAPDGNYPKNSTRFYSRQNRWMSSWQRHWLTGYFSWNIDADYEATSAFINRLYYGSAFQEMKEYRQLLTNAILDANLHMGYGTPNSVLGKCYDRPGLPQKALEWLDRAEKAAGQDALILKRIALDREYFKQNWEAAYQEYLASRQQEYNATRRMENIVVDGELNEQNWKNADYISDFKIPADGHSSAKEASPDTFVRILYDDENLYFGVEALKAKHGNVLALAKADGLSALHGSHIELFITPPELKGKYYQLGFSVNGKLFQALTSTGSTREESVKLNPEYTIKDLADRWILETRIPLAALHLTISDGIVWRINVARAALDSSEKLQSSSCSGGIFHGSEVHRSVAFGKTGAILRNGDLEDLVSARVRNFKDPQRKDWEYHSQTVPKFWFFNENNIGRVEMRSDSPAAGKWYMRIAGTNAFVGQPLTTSAQNSSKYSLSLQARGTGELLLRFLVNGKYYKGQQNIENLASSENWTGIATNIEYPAGEKATFYMRITGNIDVDDIRISPNASEEEEMPNAMKH